MVRNLRQYPVLLTEKIDLLKSLKLQILREDPLMGDTRAYIIDHIIIDVLSRDSFIHEEQDDGK